MNIQFKKVFSIVLFLASGHLTALYRDFPSYQILMLHDAVHLVQAKNYLKNSLEQEDHFQETHNHELIVRYLLDNKEVRITLLSLLEQCALLEAAFDKAVQDARLLKDTDLQELYFTHDNESNLNARWLQYKCITRQIRICSDFMQKVLTSVVLIGLTPDWQENAAEPTIFGSIPLGKKLSKENRLLLKKYAYRGFQALQGIIGIYSGVKVGTFQYRHYALLQQLHDQLRVVSDFLSHIQKIYGIFEKHPLLKKSCAGIQTLNRLFGGTSLDQKSSVLLDIICDESFVSCQNRFVSSGHILASYYALHLCGEYFDEIMQCVGELDVYVSLAQMMIDYPDIVSSVASVIV